MFDIPSALVAVVIWLYWGRVAFMSWRIRRRTRGLSGVVPEQGLERLLWPFIVVAVVAWMTFPVLAVQRLDGPWAIPLLAREPAAIVVRIAAGIAGAALLWLTVQCWRRMGKHWKMAVTPGQPQVLITDGPFARVRHPIYGYQILLMLASIVAVPTVPMLLLGIVHFVLMTTKARNEERHLYATHGEAYVSYVKRTGRFFPRLAS